MLAPLCRLAPLTFCGRAGAKGVWSNEAVFSRVRLLRAFVCMPPLGRRSDVGGRSSGFWMDLLWVQAILTGLRGGSAEENPAALVEGAAGRLDCVQCLKMQKSPENGASCCGVECFWMVPKTGLEPACLSALRPEHSASTNFATWAKTSETRIIHELLKNVNTQNKHDTKKTQTRAPVFAGKNFP